jgi:probable rRNA maturation factor
VTIAVEVASDVGRLPVALGRVEALAAGVLRAEGVKHAMLSVAFVSRRTIASLNRRHLKRSGATDVIAFGFAPAGTRGPVVGDVYIAADVARAQARTFGVPVGEELMRLVVHGTLHVLGHDHPEGADRSASAMWRRQEALLARLTRSAAR